MHINDIFAKHATTFSIEFFPPKTTEACEALYKTIADLERLKPSFVSVTYGAGGSTRDMTHDLVVRIKKTTSLEAVPHLTCVCHQEADIRSILERYASASVGNILALGGDPPKDKLNYDRAQDAFHHASDLVSFIRKFNDAGIHPDKRGFGIGVAGFPEGHPGTPNRIAELEHLKAKIDAGADYICTQFFFDNHDFYDFRERCDMIGIKVPIIVGVMPIASATGIKRMGDFAGGARFPAALLKQVQAHAHDAEAVKKIGLDWTIKQCRDLVANQVRGIHVYALNRADTAVQIHAGLGL